MSVLAHAPGTGGTADLNGLPQSAIHELRSPLTSIRGYAQLLKRGVRNPEQGQRACETIFRESERLADMLDQLAGVAEIRLGSADGEQVEFDLAELARCAVEETQARRPEHQLLVRATSRVTVSGDPRRVRELLAILLENAAGYSEPQSEINVTVSRKAGQACLTVEDHGIGIPGDELEAIFECFQRGSNVHQAGPQAARGLGTGLFIARARATEAGGRLWAESEVGQGSTLHLSLPFAQAAEADATQPDRRR